MKRLTAEQLAQRIYDCGLMSSKDLEITLAASGGRGRATFNAFISTLLETEHLTNWQISRVVDGQRRGYFYGKWKVLYLIGAGTFARVYRASHRETGEIKAVKVLRQRYSTDMETRDSFLREARMVMQLRQENIVPIFEVDETKKGRIYMVMEFVEGQNLREYVRAHKKIPLMTALSIIRDVCAGLAYAAKQKIYHRDMKLSNVLLAASGTAKLVDFGLAVGGEKSEGEKGGPRSIDYAGLERATRVRRNDTRSDLFFVGAMLYQMVSGVPPMAETRERIKRLSASRYQDVKPVIIHEPNLPHRVVVLINQLMQINPETRIQTAALAQAQNENAISAIKKGDLRRYDESLSKQEIDAYNQAHVTEEEEGQGKTVLIIESNIKVQDSLRDKLKAIGYRVLITGNPDRGLSRFDDLDPAEDVPADCVIIGCAGLGDEGIEAFKRFMEGEFTSQMPGILVVTDKMAKHAKDHWFNDHRVKMGVPVKFKLVRRALRKLLDLEPGAPTGQAS
ncbi:MAG: serine/threonine-protein kinase [Planctomycetota bacterium]